MVGRIASKKGYRWEAGYEPAHPVSYRALLKIYKEAAATPKENTIFIMQEETLTALRDEVTRRLEADAKYADLRLKLESLERDAWYIRYGIISRWMSSRFIERLPI